MIKLQIDHLTKHYWLEREDRNVFALSDVSFSVEDGEFMAIVGPSGCGKTSMLNIIAGLLPYEEGDVLIDGKRVNGPGIDRAVVFQHASLLPWRTIAGNVRYGMELQKRFDEATMKERADHFIKLVGLSGFERHYPSELSGGMRKRVGLARAIVYQPQIVLYDEPTTGLDPIASDSIDKLILRVRDRLDVTSVVVTHDMRSARRLGQRILMLHDKKIYVSGTPDQIFQSTDPIVRQFVEGISGPKESI